jgi:hypothetical protein
MSRITASGGILARHTQRRLAVLGGVDGVAFEDQPTPQQITDAAIVLYHQDAFGHTGFQFVWCGVFNRARL